MGNGSGQHLHTDFQHISCQTGPCTGTDIIPGQSDTPPLKVQGDQSGAAAEDLNRNPARGWQA